MGTHTSSLQRPHISRGRFLDLEVKDLKKSLLNQPPT